MKVFLAGIVKHDATMDRGDVSFTASCSFYSLWTTLGPCASFYVLIPSQSLQCALGYVCWGSSVVGNEVGWQAGMKGKGLWDPDEREQVLQVLLQADQVPIDVLHLWEAYGKRWMVRLGYGLHKNLDAPLAVERNKSERKGEAMKDPL